ncbi:helix-turn-helix domain-containing protein [Halobacteriaceae archaeon SHR40]|uniref:helix-turn-helix domain-containing protein n=1 Tax=Halovenus amylolytica TaxID=2500550 RepID=UPI000FE3FD06
MATVMEFTSPVEEFPLGSIFENLPEVRVELERLVPQDEFVIPYFWVRGVEADDIEAAFQDHVGVVNLELIDSIESEYLMRAEWNPAYFGILRALAEEDIAILSGVGTNRGWHFEVRGETREDISDFRSNCQAKDISIDITAVHALLPVQGEGYELTDAQREALVTAYECGYFDSPRRCSLADVADEIGITQQSLSSRLRRGHNKLIAATLVDQ